LEDFKKIKLSEKKSVEAKQKEYNERVGADIFAGFIQMRRLGRNLSKKEEKSGVSKSLDISEISLNEDK